MYMYVHVGTTTYVIVLHQIVIIVIVASVAQRVIVVILLTGVGDSWAVILKCNSNTIKHNEPPCNNDPNGRHKVISPFSQ